MKYVALFRGINVGKSIQVSMKDLVSLFENAGFSNVATYLNSGNVIFESKLKLAEIENIINKLMFSRYKTKISILIKSSKEIIKIAKSIPADWANDITQQTYVAYLFDDVAKPALVDELPIKKEFMTILYKNKTIIWNIKKENYNKSHITKIASHSSYSRMTTRNSNTARKLAELCSE